MLLFFNCSLLSKPTQDQNDMCENIYWGMIEYNDDGVFYSTRPKYSLPITVNHSFDYLQNEIYKLVGYTVTEANLEIQARFNMSTDGQRDYQLVPVTNQASFEMILGIVASFPQRIPVLELYVELEPNGAGFNSQLNLNIQALVPSQIPESVCLRSKCLFLFLIVRCAYV